MEPEQLMQVAIDRAREGIANGQTPFGCAIARNGGILAAEHNSVWATIDITAHAEINALRAACQASGDVVLAGAIAATTCEPCPMCMSALHWARIETVYFGASISDAEVAGFNELTLPASQVVQIGGSRVQLVGGILAEGCRAIFDDWKSGPRARVY
ncbi:MAG: nucleoside deaminase [Planctomycetota bacterium]|nr:nucleoside deaminase [Planctomycetota bacterium]MEE3218993.1 nucleoside deaminase [Planctomycetota bacterium]